MAAQKRNWFEKHQGLITFLGYLATVIVGGLSLWLSNSKSNAALDLSTKAFNLSNKQYSHQRTQDSLSDSASAQSERETNQRFNYQDLASKRQEKINQEELNNFQKQTLTAKEQLTYFKKQTQIAETQLKNATLIYQNQLSENKPTFEFRDFKIDSMRNKPQLTLTYYVSNVGKRTAYAKKVIVLFWDLVSNLLECGNIPVGGDDMPPNSGSPVTVPISDQIGFKNTNIILIETFYKDILSNEILTSRNFFRFSSFNPINAVQVDEDVQNKMILRIEQAETVDRKKYLTY